jgi:hypothetical protein
VEVAGLRFDTSPVGDYAGKHGVRWRPVVKKKGYKPANGSQTVQVVADREEWYGAFKGVPCEGWTSPAAGG